MDPLTPAPQKGLLPPVPLRTASKLPSAEAPLTKTVDGLHVAQDSNTAGIKFSSGVQKAMTCIGCTCSASEVLVHRLMFFK